MQKPLILLIFASTLLGATGSAMAQTTASGSADPAATSDPAADPNLLIDPNVQADAQAPLKFKIKGVNTDDDAGEEGRSGEHDDGEGEDDAG